MIHDPKSSAIALTALGLARGIDYLYFDIEVYMLQGADGTSFYVNDGQTKQTFSHADDAADMFANMIWEKDDKS